MVEHLSWETAHPPPLIFPHNTALGSAGCVLGLPSTTHVNSVSEWEQAPACLEQTTGRKVNVVMEIWKQGL